MVEAGIGVVEIAASITWKGIVPAVKAAMTRAARVGIVEAAQRTPFVGGPGGPGFRQVEAAVLGQAGEQGAGEIAFGRLAAG